MKTIIISKNDHNQRIDKYLKKLLCNASSSFIYKMIRKKDVKVNGVKVTQDYILKTDDKLEMFLYEDKFLELSDSKAIKDVKITFKTVYEDENILIVNKPAGLLVHEDINESRNTLTNQVLVYLRDKGELANNNEDTFLPGPVHRLDRNTSGLVIYAKNFITSQCLSKMIKERHHLIKSYQTIVVGKITRDTHLEGYVKKIPDEARVKFVKKDEPGALTMITDVYPLESNQNYSFVKVTLITGRMHQIRIHLSSIDHPIIGDRKYGHFKINKELKNKYNLNNQLLHAYQIEFKEMEEPLVYLNNKVVTCQASKQFIDIKKSLL